MADYTITATEVTAGTGATVRHGIAGATITAGQSLYLDSATDTLKLAQCDGTAAEATFVGIALNGGSSGQTIAYVAQGDINLDTAALTGATKGEVAVVSATAGGIAPNEDLATTQYVSIIGVMKTSNPGVLTVAPNNTGVTHV